MEGSILLKDKQAMILVSLKEGKQPWHIATLSKACNTTYVHTSNFIKKCEQMGIVQNERHGKTKEIKLTEKGVKLADMLSGVYAMINQTNGVQQAQKPVEEKEKVPPAPQPEKK